MAGVLVERVTFAGGEAGLALRARSDLAKYQISVAAMENYIVMLEGGATRRPGTRMVIELKDSAQRGKLIPHRIGDDDYYMLVVNAGRSRFLRDGGFVSNPDATPYEVVVPWLEAELPSLRATANGNALYVVCRTKFPRELTRLDHTNWTVAEFPADSGPVGDRNIDATATLQASGLTGAITLTGTGGILAAAWVGRIMRIDEPDLTWVPEWTADETGLVPGSAIPAESMRRWNGNVYQAFSNAVAGPAPPTHTEGFVNSGRGKVDWLYLHSGYGFVRIDARTNANLATATVLSRLPDSVRDHPSFRWYPPAWNEDDGYPEIVTFNAPRIMLARDDRGWFSGVLDPHDFLAKAEDDAAFNFRLRSPDGSRVKIRWGLPTGAFVLGTADIEWRLTSGSVQNPTLTLANLNPIPDFNAGSIAQVAAYVDGGALFVGADGKRLHYGTVDPQRTGATRLNVEELSVTAAHIFASGAIGGVWQRHPHRVHWLWFADGSLASFTFMPAQEIYAFARHPMTNAFVEDISVIPAIAGGTDQVYMIVRRTIAGATKRYVEILTDYFEPRDRNAPTAAGAWFVDCGIRYEGAPIGTITGAGHLEGETVAVFADGAMQTDKIVVGGRFDLDRPASSVVFGLPILARIKDLPRNLNLQTGSSKGQDKTIREGFLDLLYAAGGRLYANRDESLDISDDDLGEIITPTGAKVPGQPLALIGTPAKPGRLRIPIEGEFAAEAQLELVNADALPCTVLGLSPKIDLEEVD